MTFLPLRLLRNLSIRTSILTPAVGMAVVALAVGLIGLVQISRVSDEARGLYDGAYLPGRDLGLIREQVWTARWDSVKATLAVDATSRARYLAAFDVQSALIDTTTQSFRSRSVTAAQQTAMTTFATNWQTYLRMRQKAFALDAAGDAAGEQVYANEVLNPQVIRTLADLDTASELSAAAATAKLQNVEDEKTKARLWILLTLLAGGALATSLALMVAQSLIGPIRKLQDAAEGIGRGNPTEKIHIAGRNELARMAAALATGVGRSDQLSAAHAQANIHLASHDALTGLPNRAHFTHLLNRKLAEAQAGSGGMARIGVVLLDLDRFKEVNDTLGHHYGDRLLEQIGPRIQEVLRADEVMARIGGDEFAFLVSFTEPDDREPSEQRRSALARHEAVARRVMAALQEPFLIDEIGLAVEASAGIAAFPEHGDTGDLLLQFADTAMYLAKANHEQIVVYERSLDINDPRKLALLSQLRAAIGRDELVLHYQPLIDISSNQIRGVEALIRWQHPTEGLLAPSEFIPLAEGSGFIHELTRHVLRTACRQTQTWRKAGRPLVVSVNISARCLLDATLPETITAVLDESGLPARLLKLEITESAIIADPIRAQAVIHRLHALGVALSIDDFGTGYTSLAYLRDLPVHELKIDQSFVNRMLFDEKDAIIVQTAIELATRLGLDSVAEGIEDTETLTALTGLGCTIAQGYHLGRPMAVGPFDAWLFQRTSPARPLPPGPRSPDDHQDQDLARR